MMAAGGAATAISKVVVAIITLIIFVVSVGLFLYFYNTIVCYFTKKEKVGEIVSSGCSCESGAFGYWNDRSSTNGTMCCRTPNWRNDFAKGWCMDMKIGDKCMNDWQCESGYCAPGPPAPNSTCQPKKKVGEEVDWARGWTVCDTGSSFRWNDIKNPNAKCCPTIHWQNFGANGFCTNMPDGFECTMDWQCTSGYCSPGSTKDSVCGKRLKTGTPVPWDRGGAACESGTSARWNDLGTDKREYCCPTKDWGNLSGRGMCKNLPVGAGCVVNWQCETNNCQNEWTSIGVCKEKKDAFDVADWRDGGQCKSGAAGYWSTATRNVETRCCPTTVQNFNAQGYCKDIPTEGQCSMDWQCNSGKCANNRCT